MIPLEYICFTSSVGFAFAARNYIHALNSLNKYDIRIVPFDGDNLKKIDRSLEPLTQKKENLDAIQVYHCIPDMIRRIYRKRKAILVTAFEGSIIPPNWIEKMRTMNRVVVPSQYNFNLFKELDNVSVVPHCLNMNKYVPCGGRVNNPLKFLFCGTWRKRKGYDTLLSAWKDEFQGKGEATLTIKADDPKKARCTVSQINKFTNDIFFAERILTDEELPGFFSEYDCLVCPTRGEGFGYVSAQSLLCGLPTIVTNYSGVTEYANETNAYLLKPDGFETPKNPMDGYYQFAKNSWPFISVAQLRTAMRNVYNNIDKEREKAKWAWLPLSTKFGYPEIGRQFDEVIGEL